MVKYRIYSIIFSIVIIMTLPILAQDTEPLPAAMFLESQVDARSAGMGGVSNIAQPSVFGVFNNASSSLFAADKLGVGTSLSTTGDLSYNKLFTLGSYYKLNEVQGISFGLRYFNYPSIDVLDVNGVKTDAFAPKEMTLDLAYAYKLNENLALSVTGRYINSDMGSFNDVKPANGFAADLGLTYISELNSFDGGNLSFALSALNLGTKLKYLEQELEMPSLINLGTAAHLPFNEDHKLTATLNMGYRMLPTHFNAVEVGIGAEYNLFKQGFLRAGYHIADSDKDLGNFATLGAGVEFKPVTINLAYWVGVPNAEFKNTLFISLSASF